MSLVGADQLRYSIVGRHYLIYRDTGGELQVIDFIHGARDLETLMQTLV